MKIVMMINNIYFRSKVLYRVLLANQSHEFLVVSVADSSRKTGRIKALRKKLSFWGPKGTSVLAWSSLCSKVSSALRFPSYDGYMNGLERVSKGFRAEFRHTRDPNSEATVSLIEAFSPDIIISFQHRIFRRRLLELPRIACINCHSSLLPDYRGLKPIFWAMLDGAESIGVTIHTMTEEIDIGRIVAQKGISLDRRRTYFQNAVMLNELSADALNRSISLLEVKTIESFPQIPQTARYYKQPKKDDLRLFRTRGNRVI